MSKSKIMKNTQSYHKEFIESLKDKSELDLYLKIAIDEYKEDGHEEALFVALRNIAEVK